MAKRAMATCPDCNATVSKSADKCPQCGCKFAAKTSGCAWGCALIGLVLIGFLIYGSFDNYLGQSTSSTPSTPSVGIGEYCEIKYADSDTAVLMGATRKDFDEAMTLARAKDTIGLMKMEGRKAIYSIPAGTKAKVIERDTFIRRLRITDPESKFFGTDGWVTMEAVQVLK